MLRNVSSALICNGHILGRDHLQLFNNQRAQQDNSPWLRSDGWLPVPLRSLAMPEIGHAECRHGKLVARSQINEPATFPPISSSSIAPPQPSYIHTKNSSEHHHSKNERLAKYKPSLGRCAPCTGQQRNAQHELLGGRTCAFPSG